MGQKTNPIIFRITGGTQEHICDWYSARKNYSEFLQEDLIILRYLKRCDFYKSIADVFIERKSLKPHVVIKSAKPSNILANKGKMLEKVQSQLSKLIGKVPSISIKTIKKPQLNARAVALDIARQIEGRISYKKAIKLAIESAMKFGASGIKVKISGRLNGAEIARPETFHKGSMPLHTIRENIDYAVSEAYTIYGMIGIKVYIHLKK